jgi:hypothetical protein
VAVADLERSRIAVAYYYESSVPSLGRPLLCLRRVGRFVVFVSLSCLEAIKEAVLANGDTPEWKWTEQGLSKRRERVKHNNIVLLLAVLVGGRDDRVEKVRWPPGRINC